MHLVETTATPRQGATLTVDTLHRDDELCDAIRATILYADIFDFPLLPEEIHRDLIRVAASRPETARAIQALLDAGALEPDTRYLVLPGRGGLADVRRDCQARAERLWPIARRFGRILATIPFARMIAVTGSLAAESPGADADLDYLIVTVPGRLWLVRATTVGIVRLALHLGITLCPNYLLSTRAIGLDRDDLFTAHELLQAVPIDGEATYRRMLQANRWVERWLPNRFRRAERASVPASAVGSVRRLGEAALAGRLADRIEAWEGGRKRKRLGEAGGPARFTPDVCEGHFGNHRERVCREFNDRCARLGIRLSGEAASASGTGDSRHVAHARLGTARDARAGSARASAVIFRPGDTA